MAEEGEELTLEQERILIRARARARAKDKTQSEDVRKVGGVNFGTSLAAGAIETALTLGSSAIIEPVAGVEGVKATIESLIRGDEEPTAAGAEAVERRRERSTFETRSDAGKEILDTISLPFQKLGEFAHEAGAKVQDVTGSPAAAAATRSSIELAPSVVGLRFPGFFKARKDIADVEAAAQKTGVDLEAPKDVQIEQIAQIAEKETGGQIMRGENLETVAAAVQEARKVAKEHVDVLYKEVRAKKAGLPAKEAKKFVDIAKESLKNYDVSDMIHVKRRLDELQELNKLPDTASVKLEKIIAWREKINKNRAPKADFSQNSALNALKAQADNFIETQFNADMISGDPTAITKWKEARKAHQSFKQKFDDNKIINQLATQQATPEEIRSWIFGASATGAKKEAGAVLARIKDIVGENSPEMAALRQDALFDIMEPILREDPNLKQFVKNYDRVVKNNPTLAKELFPDSLTSLKELREIASGVDKVPEKIKFDFIRTSATGLFGHAIAFGSMKVRGAISVFRIVLSEAQGNKRRVVANALGYDPFAVVLPKSPIAISGGTQALIDAGEESEQREDIPRRPISEAINALQERF